MTQIKFKKINDEKWLRKQVENKPLRQIAEEIGCSYGGVSYATRKFKINVPQRSKQRVSLTRSRSCKQAYKRNNPNGRFGKLASNWKGGRRLAGTGGRYIHIYKPEHSKSDSNGYVMEHRLIMEKKIGRYLTSEEIVHHKDGDGHNNKIYNLELTNKKKHYKEHFKAVKKLVDAENKIKRLKQLLKNNNINYESE